MATTSRTRSRATSDRDRELREMRERAERAERELEQARGEKPSERGQASGGNVDLSGVDQDKRAERYKDWPEKGGSDLPQPWDHRALGLHNAERDFEQQAEPGAPNTVSPIVVAHGKPVLTSGSADPAVQELGRILGTLGYPNSVSQGQNPYGNVDNTVMSAVHAFRDAYGVQEDPSGFGGNTPDGRARAAAHIGPWTWEAILRAGRREKPDRSSWG